MGSRFHFKTPSVVCAACMVVLAGSPAFAEPAADGQSLNVPAAPARINENSLLYLQPRLGDLPSSRKTLDVLEAPGQVFLPFQDLIGLFGFAINIQADGSASGTTFSDNEPFDFNIGAREARFGDRKVEVTRQYMRRVDGRLFISCDALAEWFSIKSEIDRVHYTIRFTASRKFRTEKIAERFRTWAEAGLAKIPSSDCWIAPPSNDSSNIVTTHDFSGTTAPHNDVELYHNGKLAAATVADTQGGYAFASIPVFFGDNIYRFKTYDASGNSDERTEAISTPLPAKAKANFQATDARLAPKAPDFELKPKTDGNDRPAQTIPLANMVALRLVKDQASIGMVQAFIDKQHTFVPLASTLSLLGFSYLPATDTSNAEILLKDGSTVALDFDKRDYVSRGQRRSFYYYDTFEKDGAWYANIEFLNRVLPQTGLVVDLGQQQITLTHGGGLFGFWDNAPTQADFAPPPTAAPRSPVIIDDATRQTSTQNSEPQPDAQDVIKTVDDSAPSLPPPGPPPMPENAPLRRDPSEEGESLILQARIKKLPPSDEFIEALDTPGQVFLPFNDILHLFEFPIKFDGITASGFFFAPDNAFFLDVDKGEVRAGDIHREITTRDVRRKNGQLFISTEAFAEWFGVASEIDRGNASIHFMTDKQLPQEEKEERQKRWNKLMREVEKTDRDFPLLENPYQDIGFPTVDVNLGATYATSGGDEAKTTMASTYNIRAAGDVARLTGQVYAQGTTDGRTLNNLRLSAGRKNADGNLLGGLRATEFSFGDVTSPSVSLLTASSLGRGAVVTNRDIGAAENFDYRNFSGDSVPGYEVELYRNDVLIAFQSVDASGRYNFTNIPILYGENIFRIVFYGQQGQREERIERVSASSSLMRKNQFAYTFGVEQRGESLVPGATNAYVNPATPNGLQAVAELRYGLSEDVTMGAALAETQLADGAHRYASTTLGANIAGVLTEGALAQDLTNKGWAGSATALGGFEGISLRLRYRTFSDFLSEAVNASGQPLSSDASADLNTHLYLPWFGSYSVGLSALRENFADDLLHPRTTYSWRSSKSIGGVSFTESAELVIDAQKRLQDTFSIQTRLFDIDWRAVGVMGVQPDQRLREASFMADYYLTDKLSGQTQFDKDMLTHKSTWGQNFNWDFDDFRLSFSGQMSDTRNYLLGLNLIFSATHESGADRWRFQSTSASDGGSISGRAFIDENSNGKHDEGEAVVPNAKVRVDNALVKPDADAFFASSVDPYRPTRVRLDPSSIQDPLLTPSTLGYQVVTRPGDHVVAEFPLVRTTIIDGIVSFIEDNGESRELSNIIVELRDPTGKPLHRVISAVDGYFSFDKIPAGDYVLTVPQEALDSFNASLETDVPVRIETVDEFMTGNVLKLRQKARLDMPPPMPDLPLPRATEPSSPQAPSPAEAPTPEEPPATSTTTEIVS